MSQIEAEAVKKLTTRERQRLVAWTEEDGWCSACARGLHWGDYCRVVHLGKRDSFNVALCEKCVSKLVAASSQQTSKENGQ